MKRVNCTYLTAFSALISLLACGPSTPAKSEPSELVPVHLTASEGTKLVSACTPTGPELCFNAIDDNCNGVIDEGCGDHTGDLQFMIAWGDSSANVDLEVTDPSGETINAQHTASRSGITLEWDCPTSTQNCNGQNTENIYHAGSEAPKGTYKVSVKLVDLAGAQPPILVRFGGRVGSRSFGADIQLTKPGDHKDVSYELR